MELQIFKNNELGEIRILAINGEPYFVGKDVAEILGYKNTRDALGRHVEEEDKKDDVVFSDAMGRPQKTTIINESGLYSLILSSKLESAKRFKKWVTNEVLPSIRNHGVYATDELLNNPDFLIDALQKLKEERAKNKELNDKIEQQAPKVLFADAVATSDSSILVGDLSKLIIQNGIKIGQNRLFEWLRDNGYLIKVGQSYNMPTQRAMELGLFQVKESTINNPDGSVRLTRTVKVTGKGQQYFINKFLKNDIAV